MDSPIRPAIADSLRLGRIWRLGEIMETLPAAVILELYAVTKAHYQWHLDLDSIQKDGNLDKPIGQSERRRLAELYEAIKESCSALELGSVCATLDKFLAVIADRKGTSRHLFDLGEELSGRLRDELSGRPVLTLTLKEAAYYENPTRDWEAVLAVFPNLVGDVEEAHKCWALGRYAGSIFHSVQIAEAGLIALGAKIGVNDPLSGWTAVSNRLQTIVRTKYQDRSPDERKHSAFLEQLHGTVEALKNAWRNKVSHSSGKLMLLTADFSPAVAEEILFATRALMRRLATDGPLSEVRRRA